MAGLRARSEEAEERRKGALAGKEDPRVELAACESPKADEDEGSLRGVSALASNEASQPHRELPLSPHQPPAASSGAAEAAHLGGNRDHYLPMLGILRNQEALRKILMNQDTLKGLLDGLLKAMTNIEARVQAIEQEMGLLSRFTEELNAVDTESNWG
ncbi:uncharacterized protein LOC143831610 isoform X3 [Paroedura picta]|uniref:uncharacterized protein LOC143831610 isoform X3 n=1 Tax=Paroedura picta TaxID=143630 RepID=UPI004057BA5B